MVKNLASIARGKDVAAGFNANSINNTTHGVCIGDSVTSLSSDNVVIGANSGASYSDGAYGRSTVIGTHSASLGAYSTVVGAESYTNTHKQIVLGYNSHANNDNMNQIIIGSDIYKNDNSEEGTYISPIRGDNTLTGNNYVVTYNTDTKELKHTAVNLDTSGNAAQGLQSVTDNNNITTNNIEVHNPADPTDKIEYGHSVIKIHGNDNSVLIGDTETANGYTRRIAIGHAAGNTGQKSSTVAIGPSAGNTNQGYAAIAIGDTAGGRGGMEFGAIAIGFETGNSDNTQVQPEGSICIGNHAQTQASAGHAIAIGQATNVTGLNSIAIGHSVSATNDEAFYVNPVRTADINNDADAKILVRKSDEIMEYDSVNNLLNLITVSLQTYTNDEIQQHIQIPVDLIDQHVGKQKDGTSFNGYKVQTLSNGYTHNLNHSSNDVYGKVFHVNNSATIALPSSGDTEPGMNFIVTRGSSAEVTISAPTGISIIHTDTTAGNVTFDASMQTNMIKLIAVSNQQWIMQ